MDTWRKKRGKSKELKVSGRQKYWRTRAKAQAIKLVNEAAETYFIGNAQLLRKTAGHGNSA